MLLYVLPLLVMATATVMAKAMATAMATVMATAMTTTIVMFLWQQFYFSVAVIDPVFVVFVVVVVVVIDLEIN